MKNHTTAKLIAKSVSSKTGQEIVTLELEYPRFVHCFDSKTEILSQINNEAPVFRSFEAVKVLECKVAQYNNGNISFVIPNKHIENTGTHTMVSCDKKKISMCVTDKHRVYTLSRTTGNVFREKVLEAEELLGSYGTIRIPKAGIFEQKQLLSDEELQLVIWFVADGHRENNKTSNFHFRKNRKRIKVKELLTKCGIDYSEKIYEKDFVIRFDSPSWVDACYTDDNNKKIPDIAMKISNESYHLVKSALLESDGNVDSNTYNTSSPVLAEQIQVLALLNNEAMNIRKYAGGMYKQTFMQSNYISLRPDKDIFKSEIVNSTVYCVAVPSSFVVVRRDGIPFISGNCEFMTHRMLSKNASSSRAIPGGKMIEYIKNVTGCPIHWGKNQSGMQADVELSSTETEKAKSIWTRAMEAAIGFAEEMNSIHVHKQISNRLLEPWYTMRVIVTATEWENYYWLRNHKDAQPEIQELAKKMFEAANSLPPQSLKPGQWHLPYITTLCKPNGSAEYQDSNGNFLTLEEARIVSASCCAQVSYRKNDDTLEKAKIVYSRLMEGEIKHSSPCEHQATPMIGNDTDEPGITHMTRDGTFWSGNFRNWIQFRKTIEGEAKW